MSNNETVKNYQQKKDALSRLERLEATVGDIVNAFRALGRQLQEGTQQTQAALWLCEAISDVVGPEKVTEQFRANQLNRAKQQAEEQANMIKANVDNGIMVAKDTVTESSLVVGQEKDKDGNVMEPGVLRFWLANQSEEIRQNALGLKAGDTFAIGNEHTLTVAEIYEMAPPPAKPEAQLTAEVVESTMESKETPVSA